MTQANNDLWFEMKAGVKLGYNLFCICIFADHSQRYSDVTMKLTLY